MMSDNETKRKHLFMPTVGAREPSATMGAMFHHIVLLRFTPESTPVQHRAVVDALRALPATIDELRRYEVHLDAGLATQNAHVSVQATFDDEAGWHTYAQHPAHRQVIAEHIEPILADAVRTQYRDDDRSGESA